MVIAVDFDGTLFSKNFPNVGIPIIKNINKVKMLKAQGHTLILWTCRVGEQLTKAVEACKSLGLEFDFINQNDPERITKYNNDCRKIGADIYIDDCSLRPHEIDMLLEKQEHIWQ